MKKKIILVNLPSVTLTTLEQHFEAKDILFAQLHGEPLGLCYISSFAKVMGLVEAIACVDFALGLKDSQKYRSIDDYISSYLKTETCKMNFYPDLVGISINYTPSHFFLKKVVKEIKRLYPKTKIVVGGFHATNAITQVLDLDEVDFVVRGQGEIAFSEILKTDLQESSVIKVQGVYSRKSIKIDKEKDVQLKLAVSSLHKSAKIIENLDLLPFPDRSILEMESYVQEQGRATSLEGKFTRRKASIITTRGCYFSCSFCASRTFFLRKCNIEV